LPLLPICVKLKLGETQKKENHDHNLTIRTLTNYLMNMCSGQVHLMQKSSSKKYCPIDEMNIQTLLHGIGNVWII